MHLASHERAQTQKAAADQAHAWDHYTRTPLGRLREGLVTHHLLQHLRHHPPGLCVLDAGGGAGGYSLSLASRGYQVCLLDVSQAMLDLAHSKAAASPDTLEHMEFCLAPVEDVSTRFPKRRFDVVLCHTLLEYVRRPMEVLSCLSQLVAPGGLVSLLLVNPCADVLRWAWAKQDLDRALYALDETVSHADLFDLPRRTLDLETVYRQLRREDVGVAACHGVRIFADFVAMDKLGDEAVWARLWKLEVAASERDPYRQIARYFHVLGTRLGESASPQTGRP